MPEILPQALQWWDAQKHAIAAQIATAMAAPETAGPNLWAALKDFGGNLGVAQDSGDPRENARQAMSGFGVGSIHPFGKVLKAPVYGVREVPPAEIPGEGLSVEQMRQIQEFLARQAAAAKITPIR